MKKIVFHSDAFIDYNDWAQSDKKIFKKIQELIRDINREPFRGVGKPEPLKNELSSFWSRRITDEHRLVYKVDNESIYIISCRYHY